MENEPIRTRKEWRADFEVARTVLYLSGESVTSHGKHPDKSLLGWMEDGIILVHY